MLWVRSPRRTPDTNARVFICEDCKHSVYTGWRHSRSELRAVLHKLVVSTSLSLCGIPCHPIVASSLKMHYASLVHTQQPFRRKWELIIITMVSTYHFANGTKSYESSINPIFQNLGLVHIFTMCATLYFRVDRFARILWTLFCNAQYCPNLR